MGLEIEATSSLDSDYLVALCGAVMGRIVMYFFITIAFPTVNMCLFAQVPTSDPAQLMSEVIGNEIESQHQNQSRWRYRELREADGKKELREVYQTDCGDMYRLLEIDDRSLNANQMAAEHRRLLKVLSAPDRIRAKLIEEQRADAERIRKVLSILPDAFLYTYEGMEGDLVRIKFSPNQQFHPTDRIGEVFRDLTGTLLIDGESKHLAEIQGRLTADVKFGGGLLGHLEKGGTFFVKWKDVGFGQWQLNVLNIEMNGKAMLFKTLSIRQKESYSNYSRLPKDLTLEQAASALMNEAGDADEADLNLHPQ